MTKKEQFNNICKVLDRAEELGMIHKEMRCSLSMDLEVADNTFHLDFERLLNASPFDFSHDVAGISNNLDRSKVNNYMQITSTDAFNYFVPRMVLE